MSRKLIRYCAVAAITLNLLSPAVWAAGEGELATIKEQVSKIKTSNDTFAAVIALADWTKRFCTEKDECSEGQFKELAKVVFPIRFSLLKTRPQLGTDDQAKREKIKAQLSGLTAKNAKANLAQLASELGAQKDPKAESKASAPAFSSKPESVAQDSKLIAQSAAPLSKPVVQDQAKPLVAAQPTALDKPKVPPRPAAKVSQPLPSEFDPKKPAIKVQAKPILSPAPAPLPIPVSVSEEKAGSLPKQGVGIKSVVVPEAVRDFFLNPPKHAKNVKQKKAPVEAIAEEEDSEEDISSEESPVAAPAKKAKVKEKAKKEPKLSAPDAPDLSPEDIGKYFLGFKAEVEMGPKGPRAVLKGRVPEKCKDLFQFEKVQSKAPGCENSFSLRGVIVKGKGSLQACIKKEWKGAQLCDNGTHPCADLSTLLDADSQSRTSFDMPSSKDATLRLAFRNMTKDVNDQEAFGCAKFPGGGQDSFVTEETRIALAQQKLDAQETQKAIEAHTVIATCGNKSADILAANNAVDLLVAMKKIDEATAQAQRKTLKSKELQGLMEEVMSGSTSNERRAELRTLLVAWANANPDDLPTVNQGLRAITQQYAMMGNFDEAMLTITKTSSLRQNAANRKTLGDYRRETLGLKVSKFQASIAQSGLSQGKMIEHQQLLKELWENARTECRAQSQVQFQIVPRFQSQQPQLQGSDKEAAEAECRNAQALFQHASAIPQQFMSEEGRFQQLMAASMQHQGTGMDGTQGALGMTNPMIPRTGSGMGGIAPMSYGLMGTSGMGGMGMGGMIGVPPMNYGMGGMGSMGMGGMIGAPPMNYGMGGMGSMGMGGMISVPPMNYGMGSMGMGGMIGVPPMNYGMGGMGSMGMGGMIGVPPMNYGMGSMGSMGMGGMYGMSPMNYGMNGMPQMGNGMNGMGPMSYGMNPYYGGSVPSMGAGIGGYASFRI